MKILIAYDGSSCSEAALDDLARAGLPETGDFLVTSVAEVWLPPENFGRRAEAESSETCAKPGGEDCEKSGKAVAEAETLAKHAAGRLRKMFPGWTVSPQAEAGSPARTVLEKADDFQPDLIVAGSHGRSAVGRFFLGSISQKILTEASCSVRIARGRVEVDPFPARIIVGFDGSPSANAAVEAVAARFWREQSEARLVAVADPITPTAIGRFVPPVVAWVEGANAGERRHLEQAAETSLEKLRAAGLTATFLMETGNPKRVLVEKAESWRADAIFVGANRFGSRMESFLLGSTSAAVAARAPCSVEVVRNG